jgi:hypothetical protein
MLLIYSQPILRYTTDRAPKIINHAVFALGAGMPGLETDHIEARQDSPPGQQTN